MATQKARRQVELQSRDRVVLDFLFCTPATTQQIAKLTEALDCPFPTLHRLRQRLRDYRDAGWIERHRYLIEDTAADRWFYQLTLAGYRKLRRNALAEPPTKRYFNRKAPASHHHQYALAQFLTHLMVSTRRLGLRLVNFRPENTFPLTHERTIWPDAYFELENAVGRRFAYCLEIDRSTESLMSLDEDATTWTNKHRIYDAVQTRLGRAARFRMLVVTTRSEERMRNIVDLFAQETGRPNRQLVLGVYLDRFLRDSDALDAPIFRDHRGRWLSLLPPAGDALPPIPDAQTLAEALAAR
jgi:hypothetical protein